jgi:hypothetical protein
LRYGEKAMQQQWFFTPPVLFSAWLRYCTFSPLNAPCGKFLNAIFMRPGGEANGVTELFF